MGREREGFSPFSRCYPTSVIAHTQHTVILTISSSPKRPSNDVQANDGDTALAYAIKHHAECAALLRAAGAQ